MSCWHLPLETEPRIFEIHRPQDWCRFVEEYRGEPDEFYAGWELPGPNRQLVESIDELEQVSGGRAIRREADTRAVLDWAAASQDWDGIHLSWAGYLTTEGSITDLDDGSVAMLRHWGAEQTVWLRDVFGEPEPAEPPTLDDSYTAIDVRQDPARTEQLDSLLTVLDRQPRN